MYNNEIKVANKIITADNLYNIFQAMNEILVKSLKTSDYEMARNRMLDYSYQEYTYKDSGSKISFNVNFYDDTNITFDSYNNFASIYYARLEEIKSIDCNFHLYYNTKEKEAASTYHSQTIRMHITENKASFEFKLDSTNPICDELYNMINDMVRNAPPKYDMVIDKENKIKRTISFAKGLIGSMVIMLVFLFVPYVNDIMLHGYVIYPLGALFLALIIGSMISSQKLNKYYKNILPEKKYDGYGKNGAIYKDDIDSYVNSSEILIGKKANNLENRKLIIKEYQKYKSMIPIELIVLLGISIIIIVIGLFI